MHQCSDPYAQELFRVGREIRSLFVDHSPVPELSAGQYQMMCFLYHAEHGHCARTGACTAEAAGSEAPQNPGAADAAGAPPDAGACSGAEAPLSAPDAAGIRISELAQRMHNAVPTISQRADELEALGYLERRRSRQDRRTVYLVLTPAGRTLMERALALYAHFGERLVARMGEARLQEFLLTLNDLKLAIAAEQAEISASLAAEDTEKEP